MLVVRPHGYSRCTYALDRSSPEPHLTSNVHVLLLESAAATAAAAAAAGDAAAETADNAAAQAAAAAAAEAGRVGVGPVAFSSCADACWGLQMAPR